MLATAEDDGLPALEEAARSRGPRAARGYAATGFRDPCPWREDDGWYLVIGSGERDKGGCVLLYRSQDLRHWEYLHPLAHGTRTGNPAPDSVDRGDMWECPDFFEVNGQHCLFYSSENKVSWATGDYDKETHKFTMKRTGSWTGRQCLLRAKALRARRAADSVGLGPRDAVAAGLCRVGLGGRHHAAARAHHRCAGSA